MGDEEDFGGWREKEEEGTVGLCKGIAHSGTVRDFYRKRGCGGMSILFAKIEWVFFFPLSPQLLVPGEQRLHTLIPYNASLGIDKEPARLQLALMY